MLYIVILLFSAIDYLFTLYHMSHGAQEWNPIMQKILSNLIRGEKYISFSA